MILLFDIIQHFRYYVWCYVWQHIWHRIWQHIWHNHGNACQHMKTPFHQMWSYILSISTAKRPQSKISYRTNKKNSWNIAQKNPTAHLQQLIMLIDASLECLPPFWLTARLTFPTENQNLLTSTYPWMEVEPKGSHVTWPEGRQGNALH